MTRSNQLSFIPGLLLSVPMALNPMATVHAQQTTIAATPQQLVDALHTAFGEHRSRAVHAKGIILEGIFTPDKHASTLTRAWHLQGESSKVTIRFSDFTGIPDIPDNNPAANPRGFAIKFQMADGRNTDIVGHSFNGFPTEDPTQFRELLLAIAASGSGAAKPTKLDDFLGTHPIAKTFLTTQKWPKSYAAISYYGVNAFQFTNAKGVSHYIRYQFIPEQGEELISPEQGTGMTANYLQDEIKTRIAAHAVKYKFYAQIAEDGDKTRDPSIAWPDSRRLVLLGIIEIQRLASNTEGEDKALSFIPNNIPAGIATADPMLDFRSKAYPISVRGRQ